MNKNKGRSTDASALRRLAEERLIKKRKGIADSRTEADDLKLLHELQVHQIELEMQNEELQRTRKEIEVTLAKYADFYEFAPVGYFSLGSDGVIQETNLTGAALLGEDRSQLINRRFNLFVSEDDRSAFNAFLHRVNESKTKATCEVTLMNSEKRTRSIQIEGVVTESFEDDGPQYRLAAMDITACKRAEEETRTLLREKETLLREIHHRVKNNMQVISSMLNLQADRLKDPQITNILKENQRRIRSMALIHEKLYRSHDLAEINFAEYVESLTAHLINSIQADSGMIRLNLQLDPLSLDINTAIPCGLIISELISNSLKHAFPEKRAGEITIEFHRLKRDVPCLEFVVSDDGVGFPEGADFRKMGALGLEIVCMLIEQLNGHIEMKEGNGTTFRILLEKPKTKPGLTPDSEAG